MKKKDYKKHFENKKITIMGLGLLGRGVGVTKFLAECGADLIVTDLKDQAELAPSLEQLKKYKNIDYVLGRHRFSEFEDCDMVIKAPGVPKDSKYIERAEEEGIPIKMDASLFQEIVEEEWGRGKVKFIGVTGTRGKSTVTHMISHMLESIPRGPKVHVGGNVRGKATLPLLAEVKKGDHVVLELDSWQLQGYGDARLSPEIAVFTNFMNDHQDYYRTKRQYFRDKAKIFDNQLPGDYLIVSKNAFEAITKYRKERTAKIHSTVAVAKSTIIPDTWELPLIGQHNRNSIALVIQLGELLEIDADRIRQAIESFSPVEGRLQYVRKILDRSIYNDNNSTTPEATIVGINSIKSEVTGSGNALTLICGGSDKGLDTGELINTITTQVENIVLIPGTGTDEIRFKLYGNDNIEVDDADDVESALARAIEMSSPGDAILFSPGFASFDQFANEYERNDAFLTAVEKLK